MGGLQGNPGLLPLADNGGPTLTHALSPDSIALNSGPAARCLREDQRGKTRGISDGFCDVGAYELSTDDTDFFIIPIPGGKTVVIPL